jgi:hypothetical protein
LANLIEVLKNIGFSKKYDVPHKKVVEINERGKGVRGIGINSIYSKYY